MTADWWDRLPPKDHPLWKIAQVVVTVACLVGMAMHGSIHLPDVAGVVGGGVAGWLVKGMIGKDG